MAMIGGKIGPSQILATHGRHSLAACWQSGSGNRQASSAIYLQVIFFPLSGAKTKPASPCRQERDNPVKKSLFALVLSATVMTGGLPLVTPLATTQAQAQPIAIGVGIDPFMWSGRRYCWYDSAWSGPGWYWCGYNWRRGYGWGGGWGWHGHGGPRGWHGGYRGGPGWHGGGGWHGDRGWHGGGGYHGGGGWHGGGGYHGGGGFHGGGGGFHGGGGGFHGGGGGHGGGGHGGHH
jgi:hypothetical protein